MGCVGELLHPQHPAAEEMSSMISLQVCSVHRERGISGAVLRHPLFPSVTGRNHYLGTGEGELIPKGMAYHQRNLLQFPDCCTADGLAAVISRFLSLNLRSVRLQRQRETH